MFSYFVDKKGKGGGEYKAMAKRHVVLLGDKVTTRSSLAPRRRIETRTRSQPGPNPVPTATFRRTRR